MFFNHESGVIQRFTSVQNNSFDICHRNLRVVHLALLKGGVGTAFGIRIVGGAGDPIGSVVDLLLDASQSSDETYEMEAYLVEE